MSRIALSDSERRSAVQKLANYPLFEQATSASIERIVVGSVFFRSPAGATVRMEGTEIVQVHFLLEGCVRVLHRHGALEFSPKIIAAPSHFGDLQAIAGLPTAMQSAEVVTDALIAELSFEAVKDVLASDHAVCLAWLECFAQQFLLTVDANRHNMFSSLTGRVANVLLSYGQAVGTPTPRGLEIPVGLSREQLARHVGSVKRVVVDVMKDLSARGLVESDGPRLILKSYQTLLRETLPRRLGLAQRTSAAKVFGSGDDGSNERSS